MKILSKRNLYSLLLTATLAFAGCGGDDYHEAVWSQTFESSADACGASISIDPAGDVVIIGTYRRELNLGGEDLPYADGGGHFIAKYNSDGTHVWSKQITTKNNSHIHFVTDGSGDILIAGDFYGDINLLGEELSLPKGGVFLTKLDPSGNTRWTKSFGGEDTILVGGIGVDDDGDITVAGLFYETITFGTDTLSSAGSSDGFVAHFAPDGTPDWTHRFGNMQGGGLGMPNVAPNGNVVVRGNLAESAVDEDLYGVALLSPSGELLETWGIPTPLLSWTADGDALLFATTGAGNSTEEEHSLTRFAPGGEAVWSVTPTERRWRGMAVDDEDRIHFISDSRVGSGDGRVVWVTSYDEDGDKLGRGEVLDSLGGAAVKALAVGPNGRIAVTGCARDDGFFGNDDNVFILEVETP